MHRFIVSALLCALGSFAISAAAQTPPTASNSPNPKNRPNIVFLMTDDQRYDQMGCAGHPFLKTPNLDRLASEGVRFLNAYVVVSLCGPNRASIQTGLYPHAHGVKFNNNLDRVDLKIPLLPQLLQQQAGYETALIGKWHMPDDGRDRDFDYLFSFLGQGVYFNPTIAEGAHNKIGPDEPRQGYIDEILSDHAIAFIRRPHEKPFILFLWFKGVHRPWDPPERYKDLYRKEAASIPEPASFNDTYAGKPEPVRMTKMRVESTPDTTPWREFVRKYDATMKGVDDNIGRVLKALDETGLAPNTMVIHTSDNGFFNGEHHFFDKRLMYEESIRVPLIVRWPGRTPAGKTADEPVLSVDFLPTILDAAGAKPPAGIPGRSLTPILKGEHPSDWRRRWYYEYDEFPDSNHFVRVHRGVKVEERWKYIVWITEPGGEELYDLKSDPIEMKNLAADPAQKELLSRMRKEFREAKSEAGDPIEIPMMKSW